MRTAIRRMSTQVPKSAEAPKEVAKIDRFKKWVGNKCSPQNFIEASIGPKDFEWPENLSEIAALSGMPPEHSQRTVYITQRFNKTLQSGSKFLDQWTINWGDCDRWANPLMGWVSNADPLSSGVKLNFDSKEDAIKFAQKNGWTFKIQDENTNTTIPAGTHQYKHNFLDRRTLSVLARDGAKNTIWKNEKYGNSNWFMPLKYHGDGEVIQHGPKSA